jgi:hypothetical protein
MGIIWTYGEYEMDDFDYLTSQSFDKISSQNLYQLWRVCGKEWLLSGWNRLAIISPHFLIKF